MFSCARAYILKPVDGAMFSQPDQEINAALHQFRFSDCTNQQSLSTGFIHPFDPDSEHYAYVVDSYVVFGVKIQTKKVPKDLINERLRAVTKKYESENGQSMPGAMKRKHKEDITAGLVATALPVSKCFMAIYDKKNHILFVDTSTASKAETVLGLLRKALGTLPCLPYFDAHAISLGLNQWVRSLGLPETVELSTSASFRSPEEKGGTARFKSVDLASEQVQLQLEDKLCTSLELALVGKMHLTLSDNGGLSGIRLSDAIKSEQDAQDKEDARDGEIIIMLRTLADFLSTISSSLKLISQK